MQFKNMNNERVTLIIISLFPLLFVLGSAALNIALVSMSLWFIWKTYKNKIPLIFYVNNRWKIFLLIYIAYLIFISFFSINIYDAFRSSFSQLRFFILVLFLIYFFKPQEYLKSVVIPIWSLIILLICLDTNLQFVTGLDIFGFSSEAYVKDYRSLLPFVGRLSGPFDDELIVGSYIAKIGSPLVFYYVYNLKKFKLNKKIISILFLLVIFETVIISGERTSSIIIIMAFLLSFCFNFKKEIFYIIIILISFLFLLKNNDFINTRYVELIEISKNLKSSSYGRIYLSSFDTWKQKPLIGTGLKNYQVNCLKLKDPNPASRHPYCSPTHSHNFILQMLTETGIIGIILFFIFIFFSAEFFFKKSKNLTLLKNEKSFLYGCLFISIFHVTPNVIPGGSFFSTFNASLFWINFAILMSSLDNKNEIKK
tara:strand:- start:168 stop:1442 length:1275 start_codon:yes stop_codon:yes gene_type:complete